MAKKYYAVRVGREIGLFDRWEDCKRQVQGYSGAEYKGFNDRKDALKWLNHNHHRADDVPSSKPDELVLSEDEMVAYVDGSFNGERYSYGAVLLTTDEEIHLAEAFADSEGAALHNVAGEVSGARSAIASARARGMKKMTLIHDYNGIAFWADGTWQAKLPLTKAYRNFCQEATQDLEITFIKVKSHSGDFYNDLADHLARQALSLDGGPIHIKKKR